MDAETEFITSNVLWGCLWVIYAVSYTFYFKYVAGQLKPDLNYVNVPGSPERLMKRSRLCLQFAVLMSIPTALELIRPSLFTSIMISIMPGVFGVWVMYNVWREVLHSKIPNSSRLTKRTFD